MCIRDRPNPHRAGVATFMQVIKKRNPATVRGFREYRPVTHINRKPSIATRPGHGQINLIGCPFRLSIGVLQVHFPCQPLLNGGGQLAAGLVCELK